MKATAILKNSDFSIINPKSGMSLVTQWKVESSKDQRMVADASLNNMKQGFWPEGLITYHTYLGMDGESILHYSNWRDNQDHFNFVEQGLPKRLEELFKQAKIKERGIIGKYRIYRRLTGDPNAIPGCVIIIQEEFKTPEITPKFIDTVVEAIESEEQLPDGFLSSCFHISLDGKSMLNYAEWTSEEAYQKALDKSEKGTIGQSPMWEKVINFKGRLNNSSLKRYKFYKSLILTQMIND